jgi:2-polyprenyl-6-methoxyphenol hydroxylase-like FAD-dependent oxidoreductase
MPASVAIVGAGPAGAALGYLLARRGIDVRVLERQTDFDREFRGEGLMPSGIDAIRQMGLGDAFDALPQVPVRRLRLFQERRQIFELDLEVIASGPRFVSQPALLEMFAKEASSFGSYRLDRGFTVRDLVREADRVVGVRGDHQGSSVEVRADLVIGADGRASVVRKRSSLDRMQNEPAFDVVWFQVPLPDFWDDHVRFFLDRGHFAIAFPSPHGGLQFGWIIQKGSFGELRKRSIEAWVEALRSHVPEDLADHLGSCRDDLRRPFLLDVQCDHLSEWSEPGVFLFGDAAHPMSPVGGQGINIALRDSLVAANHLVPALTQGEGIEQACRAICDERLPEIRSIQDLQQRAPRVLFLGSPAVRAVVRHVLPIAARTGLAQRVGGFLFRRFAEGTTDVRLRV